jgi:hypothetical protein
LKKIHRFVSLLMLVMVFASFLSVETASAATDTRTISYIPVTKSPHDTILDTTPTYKWTRVSSATQYQLQVFKGTLKLLDTTVSAGICGTSFCQRSPSLTLGYNVYKWRVRAYVGGHWTLYSAFMFFTVSTPSFNTGFNYGSTGGWARKTGGTWDLNGTYYHTEGSPEVWTDAYYTKGQFTDFDYTALVWRYGNDPVYLGVRMGSTIGGPLQAWYPGYVFGYNNQGYYAIWRLPSTGGEQEIVSGLISPAINQNGWNTLRVKAVGNQFWFYINSTLVYNFTDTSSDKRLRGYVGIVTYRKASSTQYGVYVDYAKVNVITTPQ